MLCELETRSMKQSNDFYNALISSEFEVEKLSSEVLHQKKGKALETYQFIEVAVNNLSKYATCSWGCTSVDHKLEYLIGRVVNHSLGALKLMKIGYYDESLSLIRNLAEISNLLTLFLYDNKSFNEWSNLAENKSWEKYSPAKVRSKIKALGKFDPIEKQHYGRLCSIGTHVNPNTQPGNYELDRVPNIGSHFQEVGFIVCLNELALMLGPIIMSVGKLSKLPENIKDLFTDLSIAVIESAGIITSENYRKIINDLSNE